MWSLERLQNDASILWLAYKVIGDDESAKQMFVEYDERKGFGRISDYVACGRFDPRPYPNFMQAVAGQGFEEREVLDLPYRCNR